MVPKAAGSEQNKGDRNGGRQGQRPEQKLPQAPAKERHFTVEAIPEGSRGARCGAGIRAARRRGDSNAAGAKRWRGRRRVVVAGARGVPRKSKLVRMSSPRTSPHLPWRPPILHIHRSFRPPELRRRSMRRNPGPLRLLRAHGSLCFTRRVAPQIRRNSSGGANSVGGRSGSGRSASPGQLFQAGLAD